MSVVVGDWDDDDWDDYWASVWEEDEEDWDDWEEDEEDWEDDE